MKSIINGEDLNSEKKAWEIEIGLESENFYFFDQRKLKTLLPVFLPEKKRLTLASFYHHK
jgi:hypothetical protein